jgi:hypothetical protein
MTVSCQVVNVPAGCVDTTWSCHTDVGLEYSNCGNTRTTTPCTLATQAEQMVVTLIPEDLRYDVNINGRVDTGDVTLLMGGTPLRANAAPGGGTSIGTTVCYYKYPSDRHTGTIVSWNGVSYLVYFPDLGHNTLVSPGDLIIGPCSI